MNVKFPTYIYYYLPDYFFFSIIDTYHCNEYIAHYNNLYYFLELFFYITAKSVFDIAVKLLDDHQYFSAITRVIFQYYQRILQSSGSRAGVESARH